MSKLSIASYFPFRRIKIIKQTVTPEATGTYIQVQPDKRFQPICHGCGQRASGVLQLDPTQDPGSESGQCPFVDYLPVSESVLCSLPRYPYRRFGTVSPLYAGDNSFGPLCLSTVPSDDRLGSGPTPCSGLENGQKHRQVLFRTQFSQSGPICSSE